MTEYNTAVIARTESLAVLCNRVKTYSHYLIVNNDDAIVLARYFAKACYYHFVFCIAVDAIYYKNVNTLGNIFYDLSETG